MSVKENDGWRRDAMHVGISTVVNERNVMMCAEVPCRLYSWSRRQISHEVSKIHSQAKCSEKDRR